MNLRSVRMLLVVTIAVFAVTGCVVTAPATRCTADEDCRTDLGRRCDLESHRCVEAPGPSSGSSTSGDASSSALSATTASSSSSASSASGPASSGTSASSHASCEGEGACSAGVTYPVAQAASAVTVDGQLGEYDGAPAFTMTHPSGTRAVMRMLWNLESLFLAVEVPDAFLWATATQRDLSVTADDAMELFLDPGNERSTTMEPTDYHLAVNALGTQAETAGTSTQWNPTWSAVVQAHGALNDDASADTGYRVELALPWSALGVLPTLDRALGFSVALDDRRDALHSAVLWGGRTADFLHPAYWQTVVLAPPSDHAIARALVAPVVDGDLQEYSLCAAVGITLPTASATIRMLWTPDALYVAAHLVDSVVQATETARDGDVWLDDAAEVFLDTLGDGAAAGTMQEDDYQYIVNARGTQLDARGVDNRWNAEWWAAAVVDGTLGDDLDVDSGSRIEIGIPWSAMGVEPSEGMYFRLGLALDDSGHPGGMWDSSAGNFRSPQHWHPVLLGGEPAAVFTP